MKNGILVVDKPEGSTSHDAVLGIRKLVRGMKVGHLGTLDPFATGVLPICIGKATRLARFFEEGEKVYEAVVRFGVVTNTGDREGTVLSERPVPMLSPEKLRELLQSFRTSWIQKPPAFSARKVKGKPMYAYAREGVAVEGRSREITVYEIDLLDLREALCHIRVRCSTGTYLRSIAVDLGEKIGCGAHLRELRRLSSCGFSIEEAVGLTGMNGKAFSEDILQHLIPMNSLLTFLPRRMVNHEGLCRIKNGSALDERIHCLEEKSLVHSGERQESLLRLMTADGELVAIGRRMDHRERMETSGPSEGDGLIHPFVVLV